MREITIQMLDTAIEKSLPLFEEGDFFGDDVMERIVTVSKKCINLLISNLEPAINKHTAKYVFWRTRCQHCGKIFDVKITRTKIKTMGRGTNTLVELCGIDKSLELRIAVNNKYIVSNTYPKLYNCYKHFADVDKAVCDDCAEYLKNKWQSEYKEILKKPNEEKIIISESYLKKAIKYCGTSTQFNSCGRFFEEYHPYFTFIEEFKCMIGEEGFESIISIKFLGYDEGKNIMTYGNEVILKPEEIKKIEQQSEYKNTDTIDKFVIEKPVATSVCKSNEYVELYCKPVDRFPLKDEMSKILSSDIEELNTQTYIKAMIYDDFIKTLYWKTISFRRRWIDHCQCARCGSKHNLHVHHLTYEHHGDERHHFEDLITLCADCHKKWHKDHPEQIRHI